MKTHTATAQQLLLLSSPILGPRVVQNCDYSDCSQLCLSVNLSGSRTLFTLCRIKPVETPRPSKSRASCSLTAASHAEP